MTNSWFSFNFFGQYNGGVSFKGYIKVDNSSNLVTAFYDTSLPFNGFYQNVLLPTNDTYANSAADNIYPINGNGVNFYSESLKSYFRILGPYPNLPTPNFTVISYAGVYILYTKHNC